MGEDLDLGDVDVRQRKSGKNKNPGEDFVISSGGDHGSGHGGGGGGGHGSSKRRRRGRGGGDNRSEGIKSIPEEEIPVEPKEKKGKFTVINKSESEDEVGEDATDDAYESSYEDEESSGSWLFKLIIIAIIVSLGLSLIWLNDGSTSATDLDSGEVEVESLGDLADDFIQESTGNSDRGDIEESNYQDNREYNQWEYGGDSGQPEIIAEVSETIEQESMNDEYLEPRDEGYFESDQNVPDQLQSSESDSWLSEQINSQPDNQPEEQFASFQEPEVINTNQQSDHDYNQQSYQEQYQYQEHVDHYQQQQHQPQQVEEPVIEQVPQFEPESKPEQGQYYEAQSDQAYEQIVLAQSYYENFPENIESPQIEERHYECREGSYWDGLSCVNPDSFIQMEDLINERQAEVVNENAFYPDNQ